MREVEFLPEWYPKVRRRKHLMVVQAWATIILISGLGLWMLLVQRNVQAREVELRSLRSDLNQSEVDIQRLEDLLSLQRDLGKQDGIFAKIGRPIESTRVLTTLEQLMPRDMALLDLSLDTEETTQKPTGSLASRAAQEARHNNKTETAVRLKVHGVAPTDMDLADFLAKLTSKPFFKQVDLTYSHERTDSGHIMREFEVSFAIDLNGMGAR
jgi:Tfp pilus assembly protein PilN